MILVILLIYIMDSRITKSVAAQKTAVPVVDTAANKPEVKETFVSDITEEEEPELDWADISKTVSLDPSIKDSHKKYISNTRQYSSGANFTSISDDNTSGIFTNFLGFSRPKYVPIGEGARQVPDIDSEVLKRNKHLSFQSDY